MHTLVQGFVFGRDEDEWDAPDKGILVYSGNSSLSPESAYLFSGGV